MSTTSSAIASHRPGIAGGPRSNWISSLLRQVAFYRGAPKRERNDPDFEWRWFAEMQQPPPRPAPAVILKDAAKRVVRTALRMPAAAVATEPDPSSPEWLEANAGSLWEARQMLADDLSKLLFDSVLVLRTTDPGQYFFPRIDFDEFVTVLREEPFQSAELPRDYLGLPLLQLEIEVQGLGRRLTTVTTKIQIDLLNGYRQYLVRRDGTSVAPREGEIVLDCGACIGEVSLLFANLVGDRGEVHLFDPVPLHARYCQLQASLNPALAHTLHVNSLAIGETSRAVEGVRADSARIAPGGLAIDRFSVTSIDDYVEQHGLARVDFVKMDIEGAELDAVRGAASVLRRHRPRLAVSAYHRPADLWQIPFTLREIQPGYRFFFGHHSPIKWESVFYAV